MSNKIHTNVEIIQIGDHVLCDICNEEYPVENKTSGGFLFGGKAYCPKCASQETLDRIKRFGEFQYITGWCPKSMSFHDWVMLLRQGDNTIKIITKEEKE